MSGADIPIDVIDWRLVERLAGAPGGALPNDIAMTSQLIALGKAVLARHELSDRGHVAHDTEPLKLHSNCVDCRERVEEDQQIVEISDMDDIDFHDLLVGLDGPGEPRRSSKIYDHAVYESARRGWSWPDIDA